MLAYLQIADPALRKQVIRLAEKHAGHPQPVLIPDLEQDNSEPGAADDAEAGEDDVLKLDPLR